jgi:hypothetical protein
MSKNAQNGIPRPLIAGMADGKMKTAGAGEGRGKPYFYTYERKMTLYRADAA